VGIRLNKGEIAVTKYGCWWDNVMDIRYLAIAVIKYGCWWDKVE
jgi:hypothetical protein